MVNVASPALGSTTVKLSRERVSTLEIKIEINSNEKKKNQLFHCGFGGGAFDCQVWMLSKYWNWVEIVVSSSNYSMPAEDS